MDHDWLRALFDLWQQPDHATDLDLAFGAFYTDRVIVNGAEISIADMVVRARILNAAFEALTAVDIRTIDILTLTDGKVSKIWVNADDLGLLRQLGAVSGTTAGSV